MSYIPGTYIQNEARSILNATEMARLIRKHRKLGTHLRDYDGESHGYLYISAKEALSMLEHGNFDKLQWDASDDSVDVRGELAPETLALTRERVRVAKKLTEYEARIDRYNGKPDFADSLQWARNDATRARGRIACIDARLDVLRAIPVTIAA